MLSWRSSLIYLCRYATQVRSATCIFPFSPPPFTITIYIFIYSTYSSICSLISSIYFFFGLFLTRFLSTLTPTIFVRLSRQYLPTRPNNVDFFFLIFPSMSIIPKHYLLYLFKILSYVVISYVHLTILNFATFILVSFCLFNVQHSDLYIVFTVITLITLKLALNILFILIYMHSIISSYETRCTRNNRTQHARRYIVKNISIYN